MKKILLSTIAACSLLLAVSARAQDQSTTQPPQQESPEQIAQDNYTLVCKADSELSDSEVANLTDPNNQQLLEMRKGLQAFLGDPKGVIQTTVANFQQLEDQIKQTLESQYADKLKEVATKYAADNKVSYDDAYKAVLGQQIQAIEYQQTQTTKSTAVVQAAAQTCGLVDNIQSLIAKSGCKNADGSVIDTATITTFCAALAPQLAQMDGPKAEIKKIQDSIAPQLTDINNQIQALLKQAQDLKDKADQDSGPAYDQLFKIQDSIFDWAVNYAGPAPAAPAQN